MQSQQMESVVERAASRTAAKRDQSMASRQRRDPGRRPADSTTSQLGWLRSSELGQATAYWLQQRMDLAPASADVLGQLTRRVLQQEIGFIIHPQFDEPAAGEAIFAQPLNLVPIDSDLGAAALRRVSVDLPPHLGQLCAAKLLTPEQEVLLFQRMNFLRHQAMKLRSQLNVQRPSRRNLALIDRLLMLADWHRDRIVEANLRLVFSIVKKFVNPENQFDDLLSDGIVALIRAVEKFDYGRGFRFSTYATQVVRRNGYRQVVQNHQERSKWVAGIDDLSFDVSDEYRQSAISETRWHELRARLGVMLGDLDRREKFIIRARFSLGSHRRVHTLQSLATRLGVSKERVRQLERRAMDKLREMAEKAQLAELQT